MSGGYVKLPNLLLDDVTLSDQALRLWAQIRRRHGEGNTMTKGCHQSAVGLYASMGGRRQAAAPEVGHIPGGYKRAQHQLVACGLLVVQRRGTARPALRWALSPDPVDGGLELNELRDAGVIDDQLYQATRSRRAANGPCDGPQMAHHRGHQWPTKHNPVSRTPKQSRGLSGQVAESKQAASRRFDVTSDLRTALRVR